MGGILDDLILVVITVLQARVGTCYGACLCACPRFLCRWFVGDHGSNPSRYCYAGAESTLLRPSSPCSVALPETGFIEATERFSLGVVAVTAFQLLNLFWYTVRDSKMGNLARRRPEFEPGEAGVEAAQLE